MGQPTTIVGVDYSGSKSDAPWLTAAVWSPGRIEFQSCEDIDRADLTKRLRTLPHNAIAAMDFPFGVPQEFALQLDPHASIMPHLWGFAATTEYAAFLERLQQFDRQPLRHRDRDIPRALSPLNLWMRLMTFRGMEMLYHLWKDESAGFRVPPLSDVGRNGPTLLETMPRALLHTYNLDIPEYKGGVNNAVARDARNYILNELIGELYALGITVQIPNTEREKCLCYHDCLDSFIAAIVACQWAMRERGGDQILYLTPENDPHADLAVARLEGWIYAPLL